jgi:16S rRNA (guanine1207-N2)-methyltransferase
MMHMGDHYFSREPSALSNRQVIQTTLRGRTFDFITDAGVFSKQEIDFGSRLLIESMQLDPSSDVLDVGCGYGPIGIVAAVLAPLGRTTMIDVNERAVLIANENAQRNHVQNICALRSDRYEAIASERFDVILTNPPIRAGKEIVHSIYEGAYTALRTGGSLWVVIQKKQGAPSTFTKLEQLFSDVREVTKNKGYRIYKAVKQDL